MRQHPVLSQAEAIVALEATAKLVQKSRRAEQIEKEAEMLAVDAMTRIALAVANLAVPKAAVEVSIEHETSVAAASFAVAQARFDLAQAEAASLQADVVVATLADRLAATESARSGIIGRRMEGHVEANDATRIALLDGDIEGLRNRLRKAQSVMTAARDVGVDARGAVTRMTVAMQRAEDLVTMALLTASANRLGDLMAENLIALEALRGRIGGRPVWNPGRILYSQVRRAAAAFNLL